MKIVSIDRQHTNVISRLAFQTDPPLSEEVFAQFQRGFTDKVIIDRVSHHDGLLNWDGGWPIDKGLVDKIEQLLTKAENEIEADKAEHEAKLQQIARDTDRPIW